MQFADALAFLWWLVQFVVCCVIGVGVAEAIEKGAKWVMKEDRESSKTEGRRIR